MSISGYSMRQGTLYRRRDDGQKILLIHHNPMNLESIVLQEKAGAFDVTAPALLGVDALIAMRQSGAFEELGDLPKAETARLIADVIASGGVTEEVAKLLEAVRKELL